MSFASFYISICFYKRLFYEHKIARKNCRRAEYISDMTSLATALGVSDTHYIMFND